MEDDRVMSVTPLSLSRRLCLGSWNVGTQCVHTCRSGGVPRAATDSVPGLMGVPKIRALELSLLPSWFIILIHLHKSVLMGSL